MEKIGLARVEDHQSTQAILGKPTFHTFPYKKWRAFYIRNKQLAQLEVGG